MGPKASGWIDVTMPPGGVIQRDFLMGQRVVAAAPAPPPSSAPGAQGATAAPPPAPKPLGTAQLNGTVVGADGKPLEGAQVYLVGTAVGARADSRGIFRLSGLPAGTQTVEVRLISYSPKRYTVDLSPHRESKLAAVMDAKAQVLGEITVQGKPTSSIPGFDDRAKRGLGTFLNRQEIENRQSILTTDLFRTIPGLTVGFDGSNYVVQSSRSLGSGCQVAWYLDGSPFDNSSNDLDQNASAGRHRGDRGLQERERGARAVPGARRGVRDDPRVDEANSGAVEAGRECEAVSWGSENATDWVRPQKRTQTNTRGKNVLFFSFLSVSVSLCGLTQSVASC